LTLHIDGEAAKKVVKVSKLLKAKEKRSTIQDCSGSQYDVSSQALINCNWLATNAANQVLTGDVGKYDFSLPLVQVTSILLTASKIRRILGNN
jgi:Deuterolysin metalloprotease (M35) family